MRIITDWFRRHFSNPQVVYLAFFLVAIFAVIVFLGDILAPVIASVIIAYLLEGLIRVMERLGIPRLLAVTCVFMVFVLFTMTIMFGLLPLLSRQVSQLVQQIPSVVSSGTAVLLQLPEKYPDLFTIGQVNELNAQIRQELTSMGQQVVSLSLSSVASIITFTIYLVLMPILVFLFLKDKQSILEWMGRFLPGDVHLALAVWRDVDSQIGNYVRGKFWEIVIVFSASLVTFQLFGLQYALLLSVLVGLSVIIPYIGAAVVTLPVVAIAWFQWGASSVFMWLVISYLIIQMLDGNVLVPLLFSEAVNLHPIAIIVAILLFGGVWGFWGVFFAIPLATLVQAVLTAWPKPSDHAVERNTGVNAVPV